VPKILCRSSQLAWLAGTTEIDGSWAVMGAIIEDGRSRRPALSRRRLARDEGVEAELGDAGRIGGDEAGRAVDDRGAGCVRRAEQVTDAIWDAAAEHFDEAQLGALVLDIATVNLWNRLHIATRQVVGSP
jgi:hypothetical protein